MGGRGRRLDAGETFIVTRAGTPVGELASKQLFGEAVDGRADLYAVSVLLFELLTGERPFIADNAFQGAMMRVSPDPPSPSERNPKIGALIDAVAQASGPELTMHGVSFSVLDSSPHHREARRLAVADARATAEELAIAAGVRLGDVIAIVDGGGAGPGPVLRAARLAKLEMSTPVEAGSHEITVDVSITYALSANA